MASLYPVLGLVLIDQVEFSGKADRGLVRFRDLRRYSRYNLEAVKETKNLQPLWDQLIGEDLSGLVFVRYLQLQFNLPPQINVIPTESSYPQKAGLRVLARKRLRIWRSA